jgi:hypothetical protein
VLRYGGADLVLICSLPPQHQGKQTARRWRRAAAAVWRGGEANSGAAPALTINPNLHPITHLLSLVAGRSEGS